MKKEMFVAKTGSRIRSVMASTYRQAKMKFHMNGYPVRKVSKVCGC